MRLFGFALAGSPNRKLELHETPVLKYSNPLRGDVHSAFFIWTSQGRPEVVASINSWYSPRPYIGLAATSVSLEKLVGTREGIEVWRPQGPGIELKPVPGADQPAMSAAARIRQMNAMARRFSARFKRDARYNEGGELRLLTRPLYRYASTNEDVQDGALFALADGTSPQLNLMLESRRTADGYQWQFALAPNNSVEYHVLYDDRQVWSLAQLAPPWPNSKNPLNTYTVFPDLQERDRTQVFAAELSKRLKDENP